VILALLVAIVITIVFFDRLSRPAALLLLPYVLWVAFATSLNFAIWFLNR
jgi:tryptophan-rich sensory protein